MRSLALYGNVQQWAPRLKTPNGQLPSLHKYNKNDNLDVGRGQICDFLKVLRNNNV